MSVDPARLDYEVFTFGRPMVPSDEYDPLEWQAFHAGWQARNLGVLELADLGRRVLYGLGTGDRREQWFLDRDRLRAMVTTPLVADPPAPPAEYTPAQVAAYTAGWTVRTAEIQPIYTVGSDVLAGLSDGRAEQADPDWITERDQLRAMLGVS
jgi:hypothetical protein